MPAIIHPEKDGFSIVRHHWKFENCGNSLPWIRQDLAHELFEIYQESIRMQIKQCRQKFCRIFINRRKNVRNHFIYSNLVIGQRYGFFFSKSILQAETAVFFLFWQFLFGIESLLDLGFRRFYFEPFLGDD